MKISSVQQKILDHMDSGWTLICDNMVDMNPEMYNERGRVKKVNKRTFLFLFRKKAIDIDSRLTGFVGPRTWKRA